MGECNDQSEPDGLTFREPANARVARDLKAIERVAGQLRIPGRIKRREEPAQFDGRHPAVHGLVFGQVADMPAHLQGIDGRIDATEPADAGISR